MKKKKEEQIHKEIIDLLEKGGKLISNKKFEDGISIYEQSLSLFKDISWEQKRSQVLEMIKDARTQYQIYQKQLDQEEERERLKKDEDKELAEKIEKHEEMEKLKHKEESEKQREIILKERRISTLKEQAFYELDRANVSINRKKYQKALNHLEKALENFTELDWKKEMQGTSEKINQVKFDIKTTYQPQKRGQSKKETSISESAYAKIDEADKKSRLKQYDEALVLLLEAKELFSNIKWTKALKMVEKRILKTEKLYANKKNTLAKIEARKSKKTEEDAFKLLEEVETSRKNQKFEQALKQATQAQKIFINLNWNDEAEDMKKMISAIKSEIEMQSITLTKEEEEKKRLNKIVEERRNKRRLARKKK
ncbi:MAG: hypothetical protein GY870_15140 [archaeon]|nr:hypothetical protein [archaeon]